MNRTTTAMQLMSVLATFTQLGILRAEEASRFASDYVSGDTSKLKQFLRTLPDVYEAQKGKIFSILKEDLK